jgi:hypothetical protein
MSHWEKPFLNLTALAMVAALLWANTAAAQSTAKRITLTEAQARAAETPQARAARLSVDAAKFRRQAAAADYFPKIDSTFANLHFNKFVGEIIQVARRELAVPLFDVYQTRLRQNVSLTESAAYARAESEMLQAELDYRLAYLRLMHAKGDQ